MKEATRQGRVKGDSVKVTAPVPWLFFGILILIALCSFGSFIVYWL